jgi:hypothetical protein
MRRRVAVLLAAAMLACGDQPADVRSRSDPRQLIDAWLMCEECIDGELKAVVALGADSSTRQPAVESLIGGLLAGPSRRQVANVRQQFMESFQEDSVYATTVLGTAPVTGSTEYIDHYLGNFIAVFRTRAALALARIGGPRATAALDSALQGGLRDPDDSLRSDVLASLRFARDSLAGR